jgi:hypothetical protein
MVMLNQRVGAVGQSQAGILIPGDFSLIGGRQKATVTFSPAFDDANYTVELGIETVGNSYAPTHESRTAASFVVNLGTASLSGLASVTWRAEPV